MEDKPLTPFPAGTAALFPTESSQCAIAWLSERVAIDLPGASDQFTSWLELCALSGLAVTGTRLLDTDGVLAQHENAGWVAVINRAATPRRQCAALCHEWAEYMMATREEGCQVQAAVKRSDVPLSQWRHEVACAVVRRVFCQS